MATFLFSGLLALTAQAFPGAVPAPDDSLRAAWWARVAADSTDGQAWLQLGKVYLRLAAQYHGHRTAPDSLAAHATLDTADHVLARAARLTAGTRAGDSAQLYQTFAFGERAYLDWEANGQGAATAAWHKLPESLRLPPVLEELGENLLRACPQGGILFTANDSDTQAAWYLRFVRGLRTDLLIVPFERWRGDSVFRRHVLRELKVRTPTLRGIAEARALCASMGFERPPEARPSVKWNKRPLVWVAGRERKGDRVPANDFVFAALRQSLDQHDTWTAPAIAVYRRAVSNVSDLCRPLRTFGLRKEVGC
jgi:hypothetical protein